MKEINITTEDCYIYKINVEGKEVGKFHLVQQPYTPDQICSAFGIHNHSGDGKLIYKKKYQRFTNEVGITPTKARKLIKGAVYNLAVAPRKDLMDKYTLRKGGRSVIAMRNVIEKEKVLREVMNDGLTNLEPLVYRTGHPPQQLKKVFGKGLWKKVCKNSRYKNQEIAQFLLPPRQSGANRTLLNSNYSERPALVSMKDVQELTPVRIKLFKSLIQRAYSDEDVEIMFNFAKDINVPVSPILKRVKAGRWNWLYDAIKMGYNLGLPFDYKRLTGDFDVGVIHGEMMFLVNEKKQKESALPFSFKEGVPETMELDGVVATRINSPKEMQEEGETMHHCISGYSSYVTDGRYVAYHLTKGNDHATLGIQYYGEWVFNQMYGYCNKVVDDPKFRELANNIVEVLNKKEK